MKIAKLKRYAYMVFLLFTVSTFLFGCTTLMAPPKPDYIEPLTGMEFIFIKKGSFRMGDAIDNRNRESPAHIVNLESFAVSLHEVTFAQYDKFCDATGREKPSDEGWGRSNRPVMNVSWDDANAFAEWLSNESGLTASLPSEAQWEYFARAGTTGRFWTGKTLRKNSANCRECGSQWDNQMTAPVGSFKPNPWGLYDTAGNVAEWTLDDWHSGYKGAPTDGSAWITEDATDKVYRGGAWQYPKKELSSATRDWSKRDTRLNVIGFRLVLNNFVLQE